MVRGEMATVSFRQGKFYEAPKSINLEDLFMFSEEMEYGLVVSFAPQGASPGGVPISQGHTHDPTAVVVTSAELAQKKAAQAKQ